MLSQLFKVCAKCKESKIIGEFRPRGHTYYSYCKPCQKEYDRQIYLQTQQHRKLTSSLWKKNNPDLRKRQSWSQKQILNLDGSRFSVVDYDRLYQIQKGQCKICKRHSSILPRPLVPDHSHKTGTIRGLLCFNCNSGIGFFEDNKSYLQEAIQYLEVL